MHIQYLMLCEFARPGQHGLFDALGILDRVWVKRIPAAHPSLTVVAMVVADTEDDLGEHEARIWLELPSGQTAFEQRGRVGFKPSAGTWLSSARLVVGLRNMPLPELGRYWFHLTVGAEQAAHPLDVVEGPPELPPT